MDNMKQIPQHVAIIPDGNRRWARERGLQPWDGHEEGAKRIEEIVRAARRAGVKYISLWGSSVENMTKRPLRERQALLSVYERYFSKLINSDEIFHDQVRLNIIGNWRTQFPSSLVKILEDGIARTSMHDQYHMNFFLVYSGDEEMLEAIRSLVSDHNKSRDITKEEIKAHLMTRDLPPVDYLIRTGGEPHLSAGFMMWDIANAQLFFSQEYFPNFGVQQFQGAIDEYAQRARRLGV